MKGSTPSPHAELDRLIAASHEGQLTYADRDRLERLLQEAGARQRYRAMSMLHASLVYLWHHQPGQRADDLQGGEQFIRRARTTAPRSTLKRYPQSVRQTWPEPGACTAVRSS